MTIAAGFQFNDGMLFCADTKITTAMKTERTKIFPYVYKGRECASIFVLVGEVPWARSAIDYCQDAIDKSDRSSLSEVRSAVEAALVKFYHAHIFPHPDRPDFRLIGGLWLRGEPCIIASHDTVVNVVEEGYECLGSGAYLARYWIRKFFDSHHGPMREIRTLDDVGLIAAYAIKSVMDYDEFCGGEAEFIVIKNNGEIGGSVNASLYPGADFPNNIHEATWKLLRRLMRAETKLDGSSAIEQFTEEVRKTHESREYLFDLLRQNLQNSIKPPSSE